MTIASIGVVVVTLLMLGGFMLVHLNLNHITESVKSQVEIVVYIEDTATLAERNELRERLVAHSALAEVRFVSRDEALRRMKEKLGDLVEGYEGSEENPCPILLSCGHITRRRLARWQKSWPATRPWPRLITGRQL